MKSAEHSLYGNAYQDYYVSKIRALNQARDIRLSALKTKAEAEEYILQVRQKIRDCFHLPERPRNLYVEVAGTIETPACRIEKIIYFSRKDFPVTALLYLPLKLNGKAPGVLFLCGHSDEGKGAEPYVTACYSLASQGYVVLCPDPISQGERYQFRNVPEAAGIDGNNCVEHNMLAKQLELCGEFFGTWRVHDALCGLDYLLSRPEVDIRHVGVTGNSGGGTLTAFCHALDGRFTMAAPSCYITSWRRNIENELPADAEQVPPGLLGAGCEMGDLILAFAPRPVLLLGQKNDFFDPRGLQKVYEECRRVYCLLGAENNIQCFIGPGEHGYSMENRHAMYEFFMKNIGEESPVVEPVPPQNLYPQLQCTQSGQICDEPKMKLVHELICEKVRELKAVRNKKNEHELVNYFRRKLHLPADGKFAVPYCRILRPFWGYIDQMREKIFSRFYIEAASGLPAILKLYSNRIYYHVPAIAEVKLYVAEYDCAEELEHTEEALPIFGVDLCGIGELEPANCDRWEKGGIVHYGRHYHYDSLAKMFGTSTVAQRVQDLLSVIAYLFDCGIQKLHLVGRGASAIPAMLATLLCPDVADVQLLNAPLSWEEMALSRVTLWEAGNMLSGVLKETDLPEILEILRRQGRLGPVSEAGIAGETLI